MKSLLMMSLLILTFGCGAQTTKTQDKPAAPTSVQPFPTEAEIQADLFKRRHEVDCNDLRNKIINDRISAQEKGQDLDMVNGETEDTRDLYSKCGLHAEKIELHKAVGCYDTDFGSAEGGGIQLSGPKDRYYSIYFYGNDIPNNVVLGHYYLLFYWSLEGAEVTDHIYRVKDYGPCS